MLQAQKLIPETGELEDKISLVLREYALLRRLHKLAKIRDRQASDQAALLAESSGHAQADGGRGNA